MMAHGVVSNNEPFLRVMVYLAGHRFGAPVLQEPTPVPFPRGLPSRNLR